MRSEAGQECAALGFRACFETRPGYVGSLLGIEDILLIELRKIASS